MGFYKYAAEEGWYAKKVPGGEIWYRKKKKVPKKRKVYPMAFRDKQRVRGPEDSAGDVVDDPRFVARYPALFEYLCVVPDDAPSGFQTAALTVFSEDGQIKLALNDRQTGHVCFVANTTLEGALSLLDAQLQEGDADWRVSKGRVKKK